MDRLPASVSFGMENKGLDLYLDDALVNLGTDTIVTQMRGAASDYNFGAATISIRHTSAHLSPRQQ